jgi:hypothetical protein
MSTQARLDLGARRLLGDGPLQPLAGFPIDGWRCD